MATYGGNCAICQDTWDDVASAQPCGHHFCHDCILQWAQINPVCPLCKTAIETVRFSDSAGESLQIVIPAPEQLPAATSSAGRAPGGQDENSPHGPVPAHPSSPQETAARAAGGVLSEVWARVAPWLSQMTETPPGEPWWLRWWLSSLRLVLCVCGPGQEMMIQSLQRDLEEHTVPLLRDIASIIVRHCASGAQRLLRSHAAADEGDSPTASSTSSSSSSSSSSSQGGTPASSSPAVSMEQEEAITGDTAQPRGHSHPPGVTMSTGQDPPQEEEEEQKLERSQSRRW